MKQVSNLIHYALAVRLLGIAIITVNLAVTGNTLNTVYFYIPYLFLVLECMLFAGHFYFGQQTWMYAEQGWIYYLILVLAYTDWNSIFLTVTAGCYAGFVIVYFYFKKKKEKADKPKPLKY